MLLPQRLALLSNDRIQLLVQRGRHGRVISVEAFRLSFLWREDTTVPYWLSCRGLNGFEPVASGAMHAAVVTANAPLQIFLYLLGRGINQVVETFVE